MKLAAIDIGSNGARMQINRVLTEDSKKPSIKNIISLKKVEYTRFALRLGKDVFYHQRITLNKQEKLLKLIKVFKLLMELHEVDDYLAIATSAFREAENGPEMVQLIRSEIGIDFQVIDGSKEAEILSLVIATQLEEDKNYIHIDVGGGSTEINLYKGQRKVASRSFSMGSIRGVDSQNGRVIDEEMQQWIRDNKEKYLPKKKELFAVGTGGNINKVYSLAKASNEWLDIKDIKTLQVYLERFSFKEKVNILKLNPDRADTILPASKIYLNAMQSADANTIRVPNVGLKDGMMYLLLEKNLNIKLHQMLFC
jgi:exopolyphosphatase/guanosine-5'-triphosphate,3'-diphosphate pyrophosphatase